MTEVSAFDQLRTQIEHAKKQNPQIEQDMKEAVEFANTHLQNRSTAFTGAILGLLVGSLFGHLSPEKFDQWALLIGNDLKRKAEAKAKAASG